MEIAQRIKSFISGNYYWVIIVVLGIILIVVHGFWNELFLVDSFTVIILLIISITKQKHRTFQITLYGNKINNVVWFFIGVFTASKIGIKHNKWRKVINDKKILSEIFEERLASYNKF